MVAALTCGPCRPILCVHQFFGKCEEKDVSRVILRRKIFHFEIMAFLPFFGVQITICFESDGDKRL